MQTLIALLGHESWQVRAEAAEAMGKINGNRWMPGRVYVGGNRWLSSIDGDDPAMKLQADAYTALIKLLDDADGFVVSRAVEGLANVDMAVAVEPLAQAARKHPELAVKIVPMLAGGTNMHAKALPHLRKFFTDADPLIRSAALEGLYSASPDLMAEDLATALEDRSSKVRLAAAGIMFRIMEQHRNQAAQQQSNQHSGAGEFHVELSTTQPAEGLLLTLTRFLTGGSSGPVRTNVKPLETRKEPAVEKKPVAEKKPDAEKKPVEKKSTGGAEPPKVETPSDPWDDWLEEYYAGQHRPKWLARLRGPLEKMLRAEVPEERMAAALALAPLGRADLALPETRKLLEARHLFAQQAAECCPG